MTNSKLINFTLICCNVVGLCAFTYKLEGASLLALALGTYTNLPVDLFTKIHLITVLSLLGLFIDSLWLTQILTGYALGVAYNVCSTYKVAYSAPIVNFALGLSQLFAFTFVSEEASRVPLSVAVVFLTLGNVSLATKLPQEDETSDCHLYVLTPNMDSNWEYTVGFLVSIYLLPIVPLTRSVKYLVISLLLCASVLTHSDVGSWTFSIVTLLRGSLSFNYNSNRQELYFLIAYVITKVFFPDYLTGFLVMGYLALAVCFFSQSKRKLQSQDQPADLYSNDSIKVPLLDLGLNKIVQEKD